MEHVNAGHVTTAALSTLSLFRIQRMNGRFLTGRKGGELNICHNSSSNSLVPYIFVEHHNLF